MDSVDDTVVGEGDSRVVTLLFITEHFFVVVVRVNVASLYQSFYTGFNLSPGGFVEEFVINARDDTDVLWCGHGEVDTLHSKGEAFSRTNTTLTVEVLCGAVKDGLLMGKNVLMLLSFNSVFTVWEYTVWEEVDEV